MNGTQTCTATTNASGVASCTVTPNEPGGSYTLTGSFGGDTTTTSRSCCPSTGTSTFMENKATDHRDVHREHLHHERELARPVGHADRATGRRCPGQTVTFTVGTGSSAQKCSGTTNSAGNVSCSICMFNQSASPLPVTVTYGGNTYYSSVEHVASRSR